MLIFIAVYNATVELEIIHEINNIYSNVSNRLENIIQTRDQESVPNIIENLNSTLNIAEYKVHSLSNNAIFNIGDFEFSSNDIKDSRVNKYGGYLVNNDSIYTWLLLPVASNEEKLLVTHLYQSQGHNALFAVYKNRLIIPAVFFIWMTIWGALILSNLIKQIQHQREEAEHMALHDALTGLANRNLFTEKFEELLEYSRRYKHSFFVAVVDLDKFKLINDTYGHNAGDELLKQVALRFKQAIRGYDIVARVGGDEFVLLLPDPDNAHCLEIFDRIHSTLIEPYNVSGNSLSIGASLGVSIYPKHADDTIELIRKADMAMYVAKDQGAGIKVYDKTADT